MKRAILSPFPGAEHRMSIIQNPEYAVLLDADVALRATPGQGKFLEGSSRRYPMLWIAFHRVVDVCTFKALVAMHPLFPPDLGANRDEGNSPGKRRVSRPGSGISSSCPLGRGRPFRKNLLFFPDPCHPKHTRPESLRIAGTGVPEETAIDRVLYRNFYEVKNAIVHRS